MTTDKARVGLRAVFMGHDEAFHGYREGRVGTILCDANFDSSGLASNWGEGCCGWTPDEEKEIYLTALADLELVNGSPTYV